MHDVRRPFYLDPFALQQQFVEPLDDAAEQRRAVAAVEQQGRNLQLAQCRQLERRERFEEFLTDAVGKHLFATRLRHAFVIVVAEHRATVRGLVGETILASCKEAGLEVVDVAFGGGAGYLAVLVLALYIDSGASRALYDRPQALWAVCVLLLYWISYLWLMAHRRRMDDDPLVFAMRDPVSRAVAALMALALFIAV